MPKYYKIMNYKDEKTNPLVEGETVIYSCKPKQSAYIVNQIVPMMPFALVWLTFDTFFIFSFMSARDMNKTMLLFIIPFFIIHLMPVWIWLGNIITANKKWKNTKYYVTDKRIIIQNGFIAENYQTIYYKDIKNVSLRVGVIDKITNVGDINFDLDNASNLAFLDVENPKEIYSKLQKIVIDIQTDIEYPNALRPDKNPGYNTEYDAKI